VNEGELLFPASNKFYDAKIGAKIWFAYAICIYNLLKYHQMSTRFQKM
jgi:hypothetical protein